MARQPTCRNCIAGMTVVVDDELCERLRATGACLVQNSRRVIVVVARSETLAIPTRLREPADEAPEIPARQDAALPRSAWREEP